MATMSYREDNRVKWVGVRPAHGGEQIAKFATANNNTVTIYTVPAGKTLYLCTAWLDVTTAAVGYSAIYIRDELDAHWLPLRRIYQTASSYPSDSWITFWPPLEVPAGYDVVVYRSTPQNVHGAIFGWVE